MKVAVLGGGAAGLAAGAALRRAGVEVLLFEAEQAVGGKLRTVESDGFRCEDGPNALTAQSLTALRIARESGIAIVEARPPRTRYVVRRGRMRAAAPPQLAGLLSPAGWARLALEPLLARGPGSKRKAGQEESLREVLVRHFGGEAGGLAATLLANGVYAGDPSRLSARDAFPRLSSLAEGGSSFIAGGLRRAIANRGKRTEGGPRSLWIPALGMGELARALSKPLGDGLRLGTRVERLAVDRQGGYRVESRGAAGIRDGADAGLRVDGVICALPPREALRLLSPLAPPAEALGRIRSAPLAVVHLGFRSEDLETMPAGFGALDADGSLRSLGILFPSSLFAGRAPETRVLFTCLVGGLLHPELVQLDDAGLGQLCRSDLHALFGVSRPPVFERFARWGEAVPQIEFGHRELLAPVREALAALPPLELAGAAYDGVSVEQVLESGERAAARLLGRLNVGPGVARVVEPVGAPDQNRREET